MLLLIVPLLLVIPLAIACIRICVRRGLAPLTRISADRQARDWHTLEPLAGGNDAEEIMPVANALDMLLARLRRAAAVQQAFVADASHELRTPLAALQILVQLLEEAQSSPDREAAIRSLKEGIARANRLSH
ncbi:histidine kinase dimerization/phospho-acceptor domain-containing protein [Sphingomonas nostoxanthinifaciens]|uniref:histidine kinase dimerization/phospho-acceptor domain-containing protein n=1 Tax=Sphingomonas nostoxanthinifaciens TaxID=2872652 RepID=UPI001CC1EDED|nr:histidine kinase dimerization/phospho-acceptor domain-containing protein [Sphingomonas nostoxanthinifaciens]UAK23121.1 hypothetical protein K8P63_11910 [Sphingomonas nostoxanthinifaciens]